MQGSGTSLTAGQSGREKKGINDLCLKLKVLESCQRAEASIFFFNKTNIVFLISYLLL